MKVIKARNVHQIIPEGLREIRMHGQKTSSRNGEVLQYPGPVTSVYEKPCERVEFYRERDSNPFFHFMESLWMLAGRNDVAFPQLFNSNIASYSDDGQTFHGAYGYRWRHWFGLDQLNSIIDTLRQNPADRRQALQMWDAREDLAHTGKDVPCNIMAVFGISTEGKVDMIVYNRSNDIVWGCYGANAVHFSFLQEYVAASLNREVGIYSQVSFNWHLYLDNHQDLMDVLAEKAASPPETFAHSPYSCGEVEPFPLMSGPKNIWDEDLAMFMSEGANAAGYRDRFFRKVAVPMLQAWEAYKQGEGSQRYLDAHQHINRIEAKDWQLACRQWISRRYEKWQSKHT